MLIDANTYCGRWPFSQQAARDAAQVETTLRQAGVTRAHVSAIEAVLAPDPLVEARRLHRQIRQNGFFEHAPIVNPVLANWQDGLLWASETLGARMIRMVPSYHDYDPQGDAAQTLIRRAHELGLAVSLVVRIEDERSHHPKMKVPAPTPMELMALAGAVWPIPVLLLNAFLAEATMMAPLAENLWFDVAMVEGGDPMPQVAAVAGDRAVFGSGAPLMYPTAQAAKFETGELTPEQRRGIAGGNLERLFTDRGRPSAGTVERSA